MNRKIYRILLLIAVALFGLIACQWKADDPDVTTPAETETDVTTPNEPEDAAFSEYVEWNGLRLGIPDAWIGHYVKEETMTWDAPGLSFYEEPDYSQEGGGHLFSLVLFKGNNPDDYLGLPHGNYEGELQLANGETYGVVTLFPTDVQSSLEQMDLYASMLIEIPTMLDSLEPPEGALLSPDKGGPHAAIIHLQDFFDSQDEGRFLLIAEPANGSQVFDFGDSLDITHCLVQDQKRHESYEGTVVFATNSTIINPTGDTNTNVREYCFLLPAFRDADSPDYAHGCLDDGLHLYGYIQAIDEQGRVTNYQEIHTP